MIVTLVSKFSDIDPSSHSALVEYNPKLQSVICDLKMVLDHLQPLNTPWLKPCFLPSWNTVL